MIVMSMAVIWRVGFRRRRRDDERAFKDAEVEAERVQAREQRADERRDVQRPAEAAVQRERRRDDPVLRPEAGEDRDADERERADEERDVRPRKHVLEAAHAPDVLLAAMRQARIVLIETGLEQRVEHTYQNYILHKLLEWQGHAGEREGFARFAEELQASLSSLKRRLGGWRHQQLQALMQSAIDAHLGGNPLGHKQWIRVMLQEYYDPMYAYQLERKADRVVFKGSYGQVLDYLARTASH